MSQPQVQNDKSERATPFENFRNVTRGLLRVSKEEVEAELREEKAAKENTQKD